jgi:hypothetical protein
LERIAHATAEAEHYFLDVSGDGNLSPLDALMIINDLNDLAAQGGTADGGQITTMDGTQASGQPLAEWVDWQALDNVLQSDQLAAPLNALNLSPAEALDLAHEILVHVEVRGLASGVPADLLGDDSFESLVESLTQLFENHLDDLPIDQLMGLAGELDDLFDELDVRSIVPTLPDDVDLTQFKRALREHLFANLADPVSAQGLFP